MAEKPPGQEPIPEQPVEIEARTYAERYAPGLAKKEATAATNAIKEKKGLIGKDYKEEYDRQYRLAYDQIYAELFRSRLKELTGTVEE